MGLTAAYSRHLIFQKLKLSGLTVTPMNWKNTWQHPQACMCLTQLSTGQDGMRVAVLWLVWHWITCPSPVSIVHFDLFFFVLIIHPATSTEVKHAFSRGHLTVSQVHHSLSDESTRAATMLSSWMALPGLVPESTIIQAFKEKSGRPNKGGRAA